ncbi:hypothetical protein ACNKHO_25075 [Shigella flexneri]
MGLIFLLASTSVLAKDIQLLNVSYDPTREFYDQYNKLSRRTGNRKPATMWWFASLMAAPVSRRHR